MTEVHASVLWRRVALAIGASVVALELILQLGAVTVWVLGTSPEDTCESADGNVEVVCLGDSFTFGVGAESRAGAYPSQLAIRLRTRLGREVEVANMGWPGSDSMDVLRRLPKALEQQPRVVCVLIGCNDKWRRRGLAAEEDVDSGSFSLEFRTLRLLRILFHGQGLFEGSDRGGGETAEGAENGPPSDFEPGEGVELLGTWAVLPTGVPARFDADGRCQIGPARYGWTWEGRGERARLTLTDPSGKLPVERFVPTRAESGWLLASESGQHLALTPSDEDPADIVTETDLLMSAERARMDGDVTGARDRFRDLLATADPRDGVRDRALVGLLELGADGGLTPEEQSDIVAGFQERAQPGASADLVGLAMRALVTVGAWEDAIELFDRHLAFGPVEVDLHLLALGFACEHAPREELPARVQTALAAARTDEFATQRAYSLAIRIFKAPDARAEWIARAVQETDDPAWLADRLRSLAEDTEEELVLASFRRGGLDAGAAADLLVRWRAAHSATADGLTWDEVLQRHLERIAALCRRAGAELVVVTYPFEQSDVQAALRSFCARSAVPCADMFGFFPKGAEARAPLFASDGHCSDAGYALMADRVAELVAGLLDR